MIRLKLKMHNDAHGSHNNGDNPVNGLLAFTPPSPARLFIHSERIISPRIVSLWSFLLWPADKLIARTISMNSTGLGPIKIKIIIQLVGFVQSPLLPLYSWFQYYITRV